MFTMLGQVYLKDFLVSLNLLQGNESIQHNQLNVVVTLLHDQLNVAARSRLQAQQHIYPLIQGSYSSILYNRVHSFKNLDDFHKRCVSTLFY